MLDETFQFFMLSIISIDDARHLLIYCRHILSPQRRIIWSQNDAANATLLVYLARRHYQMMEGHRASKGIEGC